MAVHEIRVSSEEDDPQAQALRHQAQAMLGLDIDVVTSRVFYVEGVEEGEAAELAHELFTDPLTQTTDTEPRSDWDNPHTVEAAYKPGVMNPETESIMKGAELLGFYPAAVDSSVEYSFSPQTSEADIRKIISEIVVNKTVERVRTEPPETLRIKGDVGPIETIGVRELTETELEQLSKKRSLFLDPAELKTLQEHFKKERRDPTDCELEAIAARWSEHCCHKTFNAKIFKDGDEKDPLFKRIKDTAMKYFGDGEVVSAFEDNAGVFLFYDAMCINIKLETHNSPSALEPYGGAMTGTGGVLRDILGTGKGAKNILSIDIFCFAPPSLPADQLPKNVLSPTYLQQRVIDGVRDYGNRMGIPTANGSVHYHPDFKAKPTVMVGALGILPLEYAEKGSPQRGDYACAMGGRTGRDGIHGATFSSGKMTAETASVHSSAVQIGNPIEEKRMADAIIEARDANCFRALTDCGAAGFSSAIGEMGEDIGVEVDIAKAPLKYEGLAPWEIWMSESQERMVGAVIPEKYEEFAAICAKHGVEIANLGTFGFGSEEAPRLSVKYGEQQVVDLDYDFLKNGLAQREMVANWQRPEIEEIAPVVTDWDETLKQILAHGNICSKEPIVRQYDHEVQGTSVVKPYSGVHRDAPNDAVVLQPIPGKPYGVVEAHGMNPVLNNIDPYYGSVWAFAEAMSNYTAAGGDPEKAMLVNNFVTATPDEHVMGALDMMVDAVTDCMDATKRPVISGKDSLSSRYENEEDGTITDIPPVLTITVAGKIPDVEKTVTTDIKRPGSTLVMVGKADYDALGGSAWHDVANGSSAKIPKVDLDQLPKTLKGIYQAIQTDKVLACHDISEGGLATAVAEMCFGGDCGAELILSTPKSIENVLLNETAGCFVVEVEDRNTARELFQGLPYQVIGRTTGQKTLGVFRQKGADFPEEVIHSSIDELKAAWKRPMKEFFYESVA